MKPLRWRRLATLEARTVEPAPSPEHDQPAPQLSEGERWRLLVHDLRGWPGGPSPAVAFDPATQRWQSRHYEIGPELADLLNGIRERDPAPFIPLLPGEPDEALAMIDAGRWRMQAAPGFLSLLAWPGDHEAADLGYRIRDGVTVWLAQTSDDWPLTLEDLRALLAPFAAEHDPTHEHNDNDD